MMARFRLVQQTSDPAQTSLYEEIAKTFGGRVPNVFAVMGERPDIQRSAFGVVPSLVDGRLPPTIRQMVAVAVSAYNNCDYCRVVHSRDLAALGVATDIVASLAADLRLARSNPMERAIVTFAVGVVRDPRKLTDSDFETLRDQGLADAEILEVIMTANIVNFFNIWADTTQVPIDVPPA